MDPIPSEDRHGQPSVDVLSAISLFGGLNLELCDYFAQRLEPVDLVKSEVVYEEGDPAHELYVVASGHLAVFKPSKSADVPLVELGPGDFFGDMSFIDMQPRSATVRAIEPTQLWRLTYGTLREAYLRDLKCYTLVVMNIAREMSRRLRRSDYYRQLLSRSEPEFTRAPRSSAAGVIGRMGLRSITLPSAG